MQSESADTIYDALPYPGSVQNWTHPDQMAVKALLAGLQPAPVENCRVLELGCGQGVNLTTMAFGLPASRFVGVDLARKPLDEATDVARMLAIKNLEFRCADILTLGSELGKFDYIVIPGLYSWVPANVRDKLLALCDACLAPNGVAVVSYNAYPGCYPSTMAHDMMTYHVRSMGGSEKQIRQARGLLHVLIECQRERSPYGGTLEQELKRITRYHDSVFYHDDLNPNYHPVFFHQFVEHAEQHGLQYLGEHCEAVLDPNEFPEQIRPALQQLSGCGITEREQYLDFIYARRFRCTFLCREEVTVDREGHGRGLDQLRVGLTRNAKIKTLIDADSGLSFVGESGTLATTRHPLLVAAIAHLLAMRPRLIPFSDLLSAARTAGGEASHSAGGLEHDAHMLERFVWKCFLSQLLTLGTWDPQCADRPSERPVASAVARTLVRNHQLVPSVYHDSVEIADQLGKRLLELLDGSRDRSSLLTQLNLIVEAGDLQLPDGATSVTPEMMEEKLQFLARLGLLTE